MRVTQQTLFLRTNEGIQRAFRRVADLQEKAASGKRVNHFSDDPLGAARVFDLRGLEASLEQYDKNVDAAQPFLEQTDTVLGEVVEVLTRAKELAVAMANDSNTTQDRQLAASEAGQLLQHLRSLANSDVAGRYLFAGFKNATAPFSSTNAYLGDGGAIAVQTSASTTLSFNLPGNQLFQGVGVPGGVGVLDVLSDLQTVLNAGGNATDPLSLSLGVNVDAAATTPASAFPAGPDDTSANWQAASNFSTDIAVFDSLGQAHNLTLLFRKTSATDWDYRVVAQRNELDAAAPISTDLRQVGAGTLTFNADGTINLGGSTIGAIGPLAWVNGAASQTVAATDLDFSGSTQSAQPSTVKTLSQTNTANFNVQLGRLDAALAQIGSFRAEVGARINATQSTKDSLALLNLHTASLRSQIEDADILQVYSELTNAEQAFEAALQSSARVTQLSLLDFLR